MLARDKNDIRVYGAARCHKTQYYMNYLKARNLAFRFLDFEKNSEHANELRNYYIPRKLNFPTLLINGKKLRNPSDRDLEKCLNKQINKDTD